MNKKITRQALVVLALATYSSAAGLCFKEGDNHIGAGLNLAFGRGTGLAVAYDRGAINNMFSFGGELNVSFDSYDNSMYGTKYDWHYTYFSPQFRFAFHPFGLPGLKGDVAVSDKIDPYVLAHTGPRFGFWSSEYNDLTNTNQTIQTDGHDNDFAFGIAAGIRWMFADNIGLWGEVDWDRFIVGANFKF